MTPELKALTIAAAFVGFLHTILGPDHYLPFIMISWARKWSLAKTAFITFLCGIGHIASSIVLGMIGVAAGVALEKLELVESTRGSIAAWLLIAFGLVYMIWGIRSAYKNKPHTHPHIHLDANEHLHEHTHHCEHTHIHDTNAPINITPWALFIIFVFGPCEVLIPFLMYPAAEINFSGVIIVTSVFALATIATMLTVVMLAVKGVNFLPLKPLQKYSHAVAGAAIFLCGLAIQFLGL
ncbi:MAG: hypothetical protein E4H40_05590 [Candidatus Brocadiia bacterium]|nr:MAG: hypothetical protein E4H40_05590 [Candidatus Brocadiia bacterium]